MPSNEASNAGIEPATADARSDCPGTRLPVALPAPASSAFGSWSIGTSRECPVAVRNGAACIDDSGAERSLCSDSRTTGPKPAESSEGADCRLCRQRLHERENEEQNRERGDVRRKTSGTRATGA